MSQRTDLPGHRSGAGPKRGVLAVAVGILLSTVSLAVAAWIVPGFEVNSVAGAVFASLAIAVLNGVLWPLLVRFAAPLLYLTLGLGALAANAGVLLLASELVDGIDVDGFWSAFWGSLIMSAVTAIGTSLFSVDDDVVWQRNVQRRLVSKHSDKIETDVPGVFFIQIDGLSGHVLRKALADGRVPTLARWIEEGSHELVDWECDLSSQTGASQAGILHGDNTNMPAFRWYDKATGKVMTSNHPDDAAAIERERSTGHGLLAEGGVSRSNVFSGDSPDSMYTFSTLALKASDSADGSAEPGIVGRHRRGLTYVLADPYFMSRMLVLSAADIVRELIARRRARRDDVVPRLDRKGLYPLLRVGTTVMLRDLTMATLVSDISRGVPSAYADFVGYDEVAHHSGIEAPDALDVLEKLDDQFRHLERAVARAPRPYHLVVLSDHGQTQGSTFKQRYDVSLPDFVRSLMNREHRSVDAPVLPTEGWGNLNGVLTQTVNGDDTRLAKVLRRVLRNRMVDGEVVLGTDASDGSDSTGKTDGDKTDGDKTADVKTNDAGDGASADAIVLASGNLGLVSFPHLPGRVSLETLAVEHPGLVPALAQHPGVGFVLVHSEEAGSMVIGGSGIRYLDDDAVTGTDPLAPFGPHAADHLRRTDTFSNVPDLLVNSFYDPAKQEGAAFEELIGFHGGLGGFQSHPFVLCPTAFDAPDGELVGAASIHELFKDWLAQAEAAS